MAGAQDRRGGNGEIHVNGMSRKATVYDLVLKSIGTALAITFFGSVFVEWRDYRDFRAGSAGNRFTDEEGDALAHRITRLESSLQDLTRIVLEERPPRDLLQRITWIEDKMLEIREEDKRLQRQIDRLEENVFFSKKKPALPPYVEE